MENVTGACTRRAKRRWLCWTQEALHRMCAFYVSFRNLNTFAVLCALDKSEIVSRGCG